MTTGAGPLVVLMVCTGNICRSPQAAALLRQRLKAAEALISPQVSITSAGTHAHIGAPMDPQAAELAAAYGVTDTEHSGRQLTSEMVRGSDLVLCMTREHRAAAVRLVPGASRRVFLLTEFVALVEDLAKDPWVVPAARKPSDPSRAAAPNRLPELLREGIDAAAARRGLVAQPLGARAEIIDPYRCEPEVYRASVEQINQEVRRLHQALRRFAQGTSE